MFAKILEKPFNKLRDFSFIEDWFVSRDVEGVWRFLEAFWMIVEDVWRNVEVCLNTFAVCLGI